MKNLTLILVILSMYWAGQAQQTSFQVIGYKPAPGQHINTENIGTPQAAQDMAANKTNLVALGSFGGYIVIKFNEACINHPQNPYGVDFTVFGNAFEGSSEPGVIYVMKDKNQNNLPDDIWYEVAGPDHYHPDTNPGYAITYLNPGGAHNIPWKDNLGNKGEVLANSFHEQEYYPSPQYFDNYPVDSVTFEGTLLKSTFHGQTQGNIHLKSLAFGYADNLQAIAGQDYSIPDNPYTKDTLEGSGGNAIDISWAIDASGNYVELDSIHFVKIVSANLENAGRLGEISTDVTYLEDVKENASLSGPMSTVVLFHHKPELVAGDSVLLSARYFESGKPVEKNIVFNVDAEIAFVNNKGWLHTLDGGNVNIKASLENNPSQFDQSSIHIRKPTTISIDTDLNSIYPGDTIVLEASVLDQDNVNIPGLNPSFIETNNNLFEVSLDNRKYILVAINPGTGTLEANVPGFPEIHLKQTVTILSPDQVADIYMAIKTESENILPFQKITVGLTNINGHIENRVVDYSSLDKPTIAHAIVKGLQEAKVQFSFRDDDKSNGELYLYSIEKEGIYTYGWGGKTTPAAFARCWIARKNGDSILKGFDKEVVSKGDTITLYHVGDLTTSWKLSWLGSSKDSVTLGDELIASLKETTCSMQGSKVTEGGFTPVAGQEITFEFTYLTENKPTDNKGEVSLLINELPPLIIKSGEDAFRVYKKLPVGIHEYQNRALSAYPNPAEGHLYIKGNSFINASVYIYNQAGYLVGYIDKFNIQESIPVAHLKGGLYVIKIITPGQNHIVKFVKR